MKNYGIPYKGSKNKLCRRIIDILPKKNNLYDLFAGGCAVTHAAILSDKYNNIYANDINEKIPQLFVDCINGKYKNETRWISREQFHNEKDKDAYIATCWSFGNNLKDYIYGRDIEHIKRAMHYACCFLDFGPAENLGLDFSFCKEFKNPRDRKLAIKHKFTNCRHLQDLEALERLQSLERINSINDIEFKPSINLYVSGIDYRDVPIKQNSVIYCDIPYINTKGYDMNGIIFSHDEFYKWALQQSTPTYISSYEMPDDFQCIAEFDHSCSFSAQCQYKTIEKLFIPKTQSIK